MSLAWLEAILAEVVKAMAPGQRVQVVGHSLGAAVSLYFQWPRTATPR